MMNKLMKMVLVAVLMALPQFMIGQTENNTGNSGEIFETVGNPPQFPKTKFKITKYRVKQTPNGPQNEAYTEKITAGGSEGLNLYLRENVKYPTIAQQNGIQGMVLVQFVVECNGSITDVNVIRGVDPSLDREAIRVVKKMPKWTPGMQDGKPVQVRFTLPVNFRLG